MTQRQPLVLVPGLACDGEVWRAQVAGLADIADAFVADTLQDDTIAAMAQRLLDEAPERFALAGFSMGGYVAMEVAARAPERVTRLALLSTSATADSEGQAAVRRAVVTTAQERGLERVIRGSLDLLLHPDTDAQIGEAVVSMALRVGPDTFARQQHAIIARADPADGLAAIRVPTLVLVGEDDRTTPPRYARAMASAIPGAALREVPRCGHMATMEQPVTINAALRDWLAA